jgi:hypothetical protein
MTYLTIAKITQSSSLRQRLTACAAQEDKPQPYSAWVDDHIWDIASAPGWAGKWESAVAGDIADPGAHEGVITDGDILAVVQNLP